MATRTIKQVTYGPSGGVVDCLFCRITNGREANPIWLQDDRVAVFVPNRSLGARLHFLVVPRSHVHQLGERMHAHPELVGLLEHMEGVARRVLGAAVSAGITHAPFASPPAGFTVPADIPPLPPNCRLAFHRPPFNSVDHLHLHALCTPFRNVLQHAKFTVGAPWHADFERVHREALAAQQRRMSMLEGAVGSVATTSAVAGVHPPSLSPADAAARVTGLPLPVAGIGSAPPSSSARL